MLHSILEFIFSIVLRIIEALGYWGVFGLSLLESANIPVPSEIILSFSGFLAARGVFGFWIVVFLGGAGNLVGSLISYWIAAKYGRKPVEYFSKFLFIRVEDLDSAEIWFKKYGNLSVFICRFLPVIRTFISFPAGMFKVPLWEFTLLTFVGSFIWSLILAYLGYVLGENWHVLGEYFRKADYAVLAALILGIGGWIYHHLARRKAKNVYSTHA